MTVRDIRSVEVFGLPMWEVELPEMLPHNDAIIALFAGMIDSGEIKANAHGFGYQTPSTLMDQSVFPQTYFRDILGEFFVETCRQILMHSPVEVGFPVEWNNTLTLGWALIQTSDNLGEQPWHAHVPATLSGCYYVSTCGREDQGNFEFMNPTAENYFQPAQGQLTPKAGNMIIFPSFLRHRPGPSPEATQTRISLCLDSYWTPAVAKAADT